LTVAGLCSWSPETATGEASSITETEAQVVARVVEGLIPAQRARCVLLSTFAQLDQLVVLDCDITYADYTRRVAVPPAGNAVAAVVNKSSVKHSPCIVSKSPVQGNQLVCYFCGNIGHSQRSVFFLCSAHRRKQARVIACSLDLGRFSII
jgi:hypothetical protein